MSAGSSRTRPFQLLGGPGHTDLVSRRQRGALSVTKRRLLLGVAAGAAVLYVGFVRPWHLRWGATEEEARAALPGDDALSHPDLQATRAITVSASAEDVWPWIAQLGQGRGGFYSYDALENLVGADIHSADRIVPESQDVSVGDPFRLAPEVALEVIAVEPRRALVVRGAVQMGETLAPPYDFVWAFVLLPRPDGTTRLLVRERYRYTRRWAPLLVEPVEAISFVMTQKMLRGIRDRIDRIDARRESP